MQRPEMNTFAVMRQVVQAVCDVAQRPLTNLRVLDLGCAHGHYTFEMAKRGAQVVGIEGRETWLEQARRTAEEAAFANVTFMQDDVRNLSPEKYGRFDIVLCLGILYHLNAPDVFEFINSIYQVCDDFAIIETHFAPKPVQMQTWQGRSYWGLAVREHAAGASQADKLASAGASLDNEYSFWLTKASLFNILRHVGFTSVYECRVPLANLYVGPEQTFKMWQTRTMLVAVKGQAVHLDGSPPVADWPEYPADHQLEQYLYERQSPLVGKVKGRIRRWLRRLLL